MGLTQIPNLAAVGSTGNNTHGPVNLYGLIVSGSYDALALEFEVEAIGATPTVDFLFEGAMDTAGPWHPIRHIPASGNDIVVELAITVVAVGKTELFMDRDERRWSHVRVVTSANTNVTYSARAIASDGKA